MEEKDLKEFSDKIIAQGDGITKVEIFINGEKKWEHHAIPVTERIKTYEDACRELDIPLMPERCKGMTEDEAAYYSLKVIAKALNEGWEPDWTNQEQRKWYPWFEVTGTNSAGFSYSDTAYTVSTTLAIFGSHLCFKTEALAKYAGTQFIKLYEKYLL
ncbi:MAG: hypothetical protein QM305_11530 [Bacteroidota bacterium]|nr:hypothetical protein [Bacteroidota bacterium]